jgi:hypothetical protein
LRQALKSTLNPAFVDQVADSDGNVLNPLFTKDRSTNVAPDAEDVLHFIAVSIYATLTQSRNATSTCIAQACRELGEA